MLKRGRVSRDEVWSGYIENPRYVLDDVSILLQSIDAESVVISADHGNGLGETGVYSHLAGIGIDALRCIPWVETNAEDKGLYTPDTYNVENCSSTNDAVVEERLDPLGYK